VNATISIEDRSGRIRCKSLVEDAKLEDFFREFRATVHDFRNVTSETTWRVVVDVQDA
jgi:hypothetical protein